MVWSILYNKQIPDVCLVARSAYIYFIAQLSSLRSNFLKTPFQQIVTKVYCSLGALFREL